MEKRVILKFDYMNEDKVNSSVTVYSDKTIECTNYVKESYFQVFGKRPLTMENLYKFFERRCFSRDNYGVKGTLKLLGLTQYNPFDIVKITRGHMVQDHNWIRFDGEKLTWKDIDAGNYSKWEGRC